MAKWWDDLKEKAVEYLTDRYGGDKAVSNIIGDATALTGAYTTIADQKRANEAMESAYRDYTRDKAESQETINAALALGLQPMAVSNQPTTKAAITDFTEVQDVAKGGLMSLPNKKRKKYSTGPELEDVEEMDEEIITPFDLKNEEGVPIGPMVEVEKILKKLRKQGVIDENTSQDEIKKIVDMIMAKGGPNEFNDDGVPMELEEIPITPYDLQMEEGVPIGPMVQEPELVKPPWMTQEEFLNFQYSRNQAARGGIMKLRHGGRPGYQQGIGPNQGSPSIMAKAVTDMEKQDAYGVSMDDTNVTEERTYPTDHKFWELVDWEYEDKKSKEKEDAINADMEAGMAWEDIEKKYNLKSFEDISIKETEREETDSGNKVKEIFETIKEKVGSIDFSRLSPYPFAQGGRIRKDNGGIMNLGGMEKDYRTTGGFVPIGAYERKDDVPARLSKNEFVMTADAVRAAGGGSINQGAQKMYNIMKNLEAQPTAKRRIA